MTRTDTPSDAPPVPLAARILRPRTILIICAISTLLLTGLVSGYALITAVFSGLSAGCLIAALWAGGILLTEVLPGGTMPLRWRLLLGAGFGIGTGAILTLALGCAGMLDRRLILVLLGLATVVGVTRLTRLLRTDPGKCADPDDTNRPTRTTPQPAPTAPADGRPDPTRALYLLVIPFTVLALLAAAQAPGYLWSEEGYGYDALEYHLEMPREYFDAGHIRYAPHNVYASFPENVEMLYLLSMILVRDAQSAGGIANYVHLFLGALAVGAMYLAGREWSPAAGNIAAVMTVCTGWFVYLAGLAYVENGMLLFAALSIACLIRGTRRAPLPPENEPPAPRRTRWLVAAGAMAGFACGCKYPAVPMFALPLAVGAAILTSGSMMHRLRAAGVFLTATLLTFSPWLIKNTVSTGNPVFPLANHVFGAYPPGWDSDSQARWDRGHQPAPDESTVLQRIRVFGRRIILDPDQRFGPLILLLGIVLLPWRRLDRQDAVLGLMILTQIGVWLFFTHLYARFAVVLLIPLALLAARGATLRPVGRCRRVALAVIVLGLVVNLRFTADLYAREHPPEHRGVAEWIQRGDLPGFEYLGVINKELPADAHVLMLGDAKAFYVKPNVTYYVVFNVNPFAQIVRSGATPAGIVHWLTEQGYTHVLVNWLEIKRLRTSRYGFPPEITPALFDHLAGAGLSLVQPFTLLDGQLRYIDLYQTPESVKEPNRAR